VITCIITMAGRGSRFAPKYGNLPKFMIEVNGQTLFHHSLSSLPLKIIDYFIFVCRQSDRSLGLEEMIENSITQKFDVVFLNEVLAGQALSANSAMHLVDPRSELIIYNIDTKFVSSTLSQNLRNNDERASFIGAFIDESENSHWSFARIKDDLVIETAEKVKISNYALSGLYHFSAASLFSYGVDWLISHRIKLNSEYFIAPIYNKLIDDGLVVRLDMTSEIFPLGTPAEVSLFGETAL